MSNKFERGNWTLALRDAERELSEAESKVKRLKNAVTVIREKIKRREPWPGASTATRQ